MHKTLIVLFHGMRTQHGAALRHVLGHIINGDPSKEMNYEIGVFPFLTLSCVKSEIHDHRAINAVLLQSGVARHLNYLTIDVSNDYADPMDLQVLANLPGDALRIYQAFLLDCVEDYESGEIDLEATLEKLKSKGNETNTKTIDLSMDDLLDIMKERGGGKEVLTEQELARLEFLENQ